MKTKTMTVAEYRKAPGANYSRLKLLLRSPLHFHLAPDEIEPTMAMMMGSAVDEWILEGKVKPYAIKPAHNPNGDVTDLYHGNKKWCRQWLHDTKATGVSIYSPDEWERTSSMQRALENSPEFNRILELCPNRQTPYFAKYRGVNLKILVDIDGHDGERRCFGDLKCTNDASPRMFGKKAASMHYDFQIAMYGTVLALAEGLESPPSPFWTVVEESYANPVVVYAVPDDAWSNGMRKLDRCIDLYLQCTESGEWPGYGSGIQELPWPRWANEDAA